MQPNVQAPQWPQPPQWTPELEQQVMAAWSAQFGTPAPAPAGTPSFEAAQAAAQAAPAPGQTPSQAPAPGGAGDVVRAAMRVALGFAFIAGVGYVSWLAWRSFAQGEHSHGVEVQGTGPAVADA